MYKHGNYAQFNMQTAQKGSASTSRYVPVYVGALPVHTVAGGGAKVNEPILLEDFTHAVRTVGYTDDWDNYDLCEAIYAHFALTQAGPIAVINVFDPTKNKKGKTTTANVISNQVILGSMGNAILDSFTIEGKEKDIDYTLSYDYTSERITVRGAYKGALSGSISVSYDEVTPGVTQEDVIGKTDGEGTDSGVYLIRRIYQDTGKIPSRLLCPGFSHIPAVHEAMEAVCSQIGGHFDVFMLTDLPIENAGSAMKPSEVTTWKSENFYTKDNEKTFWPRWNGNDGRMYHLSVLCAANFQALENEADGVPYQTASNTKIPISGKPYYGEGATLALDEQMVNETLLQYGVTSCTYHGGSWVLWGSHCASYEPGNVTSMNLYDSTLMMMYYLANDFQVRRAEEIDKIASVNRIKQIVAEEQATLDALCAIGALLYGKTFFVLNGETRSDMLTGDFALRWEITQSLAIKSITGTVQHTDAGLATYYEELMELTE